MHPIHHSSRALERLVVAVVFAISTVSWFVLTWVSHQHEGWDSAPYFITVLPLSIVIGAICGRVFGRANWRWPLAFAAGQFAGLVALSHGNVSLWPLTISILLVLSMPCWVAALASARLRPAKMIESTRSH